MSELIITHQSIEEIKQTAAKQSMSSNFKQTQDVNVNINTKTKKMRKNNMSINAKQKIWEIYNQDSDARTCPMECVFQNEETDLCNACNSTLMITEDGFPTCANPSCGIIYTNALDYSPEWRFFGADDKNSADPTRCGNPINPLLVESSYGCQLICNAGASHEMKKISKWTKWNSMPHKEKTLYDEFQFITIMAQNSGIPRIFIDDAMAIHKDISEQKIFRGLNRDGIKAASIYISCRLNGCPRTSHEIAEIFNLDKTSATNGCSMAVNIMHNIERNTATSQNAPIDLGSTTPSSFIERYCSKLNISPELIMLAKFISNKLEKNEIITDNTPHSIAAGIIYFVAQTCNLNITKVDIKKVCGVSEVTVNKCYKKMLNISDQLIPAAIRAKYSNVHTPTNTNNMISV